MLVWEAHRDLSLSIGDAVTCTSGSTPDGVRYSSSLRNSYLYRAMLEILKQTLSQLASVPRAITASYIYRLFPSMIQVESSALTPFWVVMPGLSAFQTDATTYIIAYLLNVRAYKLDVTGNPVSIPIPVKDTHQLVTLHNSRNVQRPDSFAVYDGTGIVTMYSDSNNETIDTGTNYTIWYLPYPPNPEDQDTNEVLLFEERYIPQIMALATLYAKMDSQEIDSEERFLAMSINTQIGGQNADK